MTLNIPTCSPHRTGLRLTVALATGVATSARADEGGVPFWFSGQYGSFAAVPPEPGWSLPMEGYYYSGKESFAGELPTGDPASARLKSKGTVLLTQPTYAPETSVWGGQLSLGLGFGIGSNDTDADVTLIPSGDAFPYSDQASGITDLYPIASLAWNRGNDNWMTYVTGAIPVGDYDPERLSNIGLGHGALDLGGGYTYLNETTGFEYSAVLGFTYNWENPDTDYQNGVDMHLDWAVSRMLNEQLQVGVVGYVYDQLSDDNVSGIRVAGLKSSVVAIGPQVGYLFTINGHDAYFNLRAYKEFDATNRAEGTAVFGSLLIPLGGKKTQ